MKIKFLISVIFILSSLIIKAQTNEEKAYDKGMQAIELMDKGQAAQAIKLLEEAQKLDPKSISYPYEIAYAYTMQEEYAKAIKVLNGLKKHKDVNDRVYQLLGNCLDMSGDAKKAIAVYDEGLKLFPNSGFLHLERGNMELAAEEYSNALDYYEEGIRVAPWFPSNYYWASIIYCNSTEEVWGMLYGEIFMNLERSSKRTARISKLLFDTYNSQITFTNDTSLAVSFTQNNTINISDINDTGGIKLPWALMVYEPTLMIACLGEKEIDIESLNRIRTAFMESYFMGENYLKYPNILFDYQKKVQDAGHLDAYNHWILMKGDEEKFEAWYDENRSKYEAFVEWFSENPLEVDEGHSFHRTQY